MKLTASISLALALAAFLAFFGDVALGAAGVGSIFADVPQMLTLFLAVILFVIGVLAREAEAKKD